VLAVVGALAHGLATSGGGGGTEVNALRRSGDAAHQPAVRGKDREFSPAVSPLTAQKRAGATSLPPSGERLQNYSASMRLRLNDVDGLSDATVKALRIARGLGGYVVSVQYGSSTREHGDAYMTLRVPVEHVQRAIVRFSSLGTILQQDVSIQDVQPRVDRLERRIVEFRSQIAAIDAQLGRPGLTEADRARLQFRRQRLARQLRSAVRARQGTIRHAQFATVSVVLTTEKAEKKAAAPSRFERTIDDAGGILLAEAAWTLLILAVVLPFVLLLALAVWGVRAARRFGDRRLLESS